MMMPSNRLDELSDEEFLRLFERCEVTTEEWTHEAHVRMAFLFLSKYSVVESLEMVRQGIQRLNAVIGVSGAGYHETITVAYLKVIASRLRDGRKHTWPSFRSAHPDLLSSKFLERHYSRDYLGSREAREGFVAPDREGLPDVSDEEK